MARRRDPRDLSVRRLTGEGAAGGASAGADDPKPGATLEGCAKRQPAVATLIVRLRKLHAVEEVDLEESAKGDTGSSSSTVSAAGDCGRFYKFSVKTVFTPRPAATPAGEAKGGERVPASLGGGS